MSEYQGQLLSPMHPQYRMVKRVLDRLIPHSGLSEEKNKWEVHVINDDQKNAFVIPGGKVFVFSGILDVCQGEDGLAAVLGHEIAHNVAHHAAERMSSTVALLPIAIIAGLFLGLGDVLPRMAVDLAFLKPGSRNQEVRSGLLLCNVKRRKSLTRCCREKPTTLDSVRGPQDGDYLQQELTPCSDDGRSMLRSKCRRRSMVSNGKGRAISTSSIPLNTPFQSQPNGEDSGVAA